MRSWINPDASGWREIVLELSGVDCPAFAETLSQVHTEAEVVTIDDEGTLLFDWTCGSPDV